MTPLDSASTQRHIGRYRLEEVLGRGGMGVVHAAYDESQHRRVALKLLRPGDPDQASAERFAREMQIAISLEHPNVVPVYEIGEDEGVRYLAMRLVDGEDLGAVIRREGALDPERVARLGRQIGAALDAAHAQGLVHRDVKPANVLLTGHGDEEHAYLTDFGLTRAADDGLTLTGQWIGTVDYAAPEQIEAGPLSARTDVYALGCVLFHALTGGLPFTGTFTAKAMAHATTPLPSVRLPASRHGARIDAVLARATAKDPEARYASAGACTRALATAITAPAEDPGQATSAMPMLVLPRDGDGDGATAATTVQPAAPAARPARAPRPPVPAAAPRERARAQPSAPPAAAAAPDPRATTPPAGTERHRTRLLALGAAALIVLAIVAVLAAGSGGGGAAKTAAGTTAKKQATSKQQATAGTAAAKPAATKPAPAPVAAPPTVAYTAAQGGYTTRVPAGWSTGGEQGSGGVLRTIFTAPDGQTLLIDATPTMAPSFGREGRTVTGITRFSTALGPVVGYRFSGQPGYCAGGCVDYQLDLGGHGFAVLAGPTPAARAAAHRAIASLQATAPATPPAATTPAATTPAPAAPTPDPAAQLPPGKQKKHGKKGGG